MILNFRFNFRSKKSPLKLQPKRLDELYAEDSLFDELYEDKEWDKSCLKFPNIFLTVNHSHFSRTRSNESRGQSNESSGFDEKDIGIEKDHHSSTPFGKENDRNLVNQNEEFSFGTHEINRSKPISSMDTICSTAKYRFDSDSTKVTVDPLQPRALLFSPVTLAANCNVQNMPQPPIDDFFATPSVKPPPTTGRIIFSSSQHKQRQPRKLDSDYQKTLFTTPQTVTNSHISTNTSDFATDSFSLLRNPSFVTVLSPIDEEKISIDDFLSVSANDSGMALANKVIEINGKEFVLKKKVGSGGSCLVYSSKCKTDGADRALKVVNLRTDAANVESYLNETKLLGRLQGNASVIKLFEQ